MSEKIPPPQTRGGAKSDRDPRSDPNDYPDFTGRPPLILCPHCDSSVPAGEFCGHCGAHLGTADTRRRHAFAAVPSEPVLHLNIVSTLFPHLSHRQGAPFRWALIAGVIFVAALAVVHLFAPATAAAAFLLPALYLLYLYEVEVYDEEPWLLVGATMVAGAVLGYLFTVVVGGAASQLDLTGDSPAGFALRGIGIPLMAQALMLVGPLFLFAARGHYREPLDGLAFGAASALGFSLASELTALWPVITGPLFASGDPVDWAFRLLRAGVLVSLVNATTTSALTAALWLHRYDRRRSERAWEASILVTLLVAAGSQLVLGILTFVVPNLVEQVLIWAVAALALLLYSRQVIHQSLLAEGSIHEIGPDSQCPECHHVVPTMLFCPNCGAARAAAARSSRGGATR